MLKLVCILRWSIIIAIVHSCAANNYTCYEKTNPQWFFSTLTSYNYVSPKKINLPIGTPVQLFMVTKHGTSHPSWDGHERKHYHRHQMWKKLEISKNAEMCPSDIEAIERWQPKRKYEVGLVQKGKDEIMELAQRIRKAFQDMFINQYNTADYYVLTRWEQHSKDTGKVFLNTIFQNRNIDTVPVCDKNDKILMTEHYMESSPNVRRIDNHELIHFLRSDDIKNVIERVLKKIGRKPENFPDDYNLVSSLYTTCGTERSHDEKSIPPLCRVFCNEDLDVLEYLKDLIYYFGEGHGNPFSVKYGCPMAIRLLESFKNKIRGKGPKGVFYFGNTINILNLYVMLGLAKDVAPLMASNYKSMKNRNWRSSLLAPLAANFMAVLYKIGNILYHVAFYFNEKRMRITLNDGSTCEKCEWSKIKEKLEQYIYDYRCTSDTDINYPSYSNSNPYWNFSTMTAYSLVSSNEIKKTQSDIPVQIFAVMQHGVTRPSDEFFKEWTRYNAYKYKITARAEMSWSDINFIQNWSCSLLKVTNDIEGSFKVKSLANRIRKAFPNLFTKTFELKNFKVLSRPEQICKDYGELFLQSIFTDESIKSEKWENDNQLLMVSSRPKEISKGEKCGTVFLNCILKNKSTASQPEWEHINQLLMMDKLNKDYLKDIAELEKFKKSDVVKNVLKRVSVKMGLEPGAFGDDFGFIYYAYNACRFERSFNDQSFPALCRIFCREDLKVLEYIYDLLWYYTAGYGNPSNLQQACPMARSLLETFKRKTEGNGPNGTFHFGNALNIFNIYVMLGLAKDDAPIKSSNYKDMVNRKWKSSSMVPWLANFMAVLFKNKIGEYYVAFYFNEKRTPITLNNGNACEECPWTEIEKLLLKYINDNQC